MEARNVKKTEKLLPPYERNIPESFEVRFSSQRDWRLWETVAFYLGGVGAGLYVISQFLNFRAGLIGGFLLVVIFKNIAHLLSASRPARALRAFANPRTSWISRGAYFIVLFAVFGALDIACRSGLIKGGEVMGKSLSFLALFLACMIMIYIGFVMAQSRVMPLWNSPLLPVIFLTYSIALGAGLLMILLSINGMAHEIVFLRRVFILTVTATIFCVAVHLLVMMYSTKTAKESAELLIKGKSGILFVEGAVVAGLLIPLILTGYTQVMGSASEPIAISSGILILIGGFIFESSFLKAGIYNPLVDLD